MSFIERMFGSNHAGLVKALDLTHKRNQAIVSNIANAETPMYRATDLNFAGELEKAFGASRNAVAKTNSKHLDVSSANGQAHFVPDNAGVTKPDGNNVDIDIQMGQLTFNSGRYSGAARMLRKQIQLLKTAIREGGR